MAGSSSQTILPRRNDSSIVKPKNRCNVVGCRGKLNADDVSTENVCKKHMMTAMRTDNENLVCSLQSCNKKARSSGYCTKHSPDDYVQRTDLLPEFKDEKSELNLAHVQACINVKNKKRNETISKGRRR